MFELLSNGGCGSLWVGCVCVSFTKPLEDSRGCWQIFLILTHTHTQSTDTMDVAKLPPAALTAENTEMEGGKGKQRVERQEYLKGRRRMQGRRTRWKVWGWWTKGQEIKGGEEEWRRGKGESRRKRLREKKLRDESKEGDLNGKESSTLRRR